MKNYTITVNGNTYEVTVEEGFKSVNQATPVAPVQPAPAVKPAAAVQSAPAPTPTAPAAKPVASGTAGSVQVNAPMPGKIVSVKVNVGQSVKKGDVVVILEAMKMENEIVASEDGTIASVNVTAGQSVEAGDILVTLN